MGEDDDLPEFLSEMGHRMVRLSQESTGHNMHAHRRNIFLGSTGRLLKEAGEYVLAQRAIGMMPEKEIRAVVEPMIGMAETFAECGSNDLLSKMRS